MNERIGYHDSLRPMLAEIKRAGEQAALPTGHLLTFSRKQARQPRVVNLNAVVQETKKILQRVIGEDIELTVISIGGSCAVEADTGQLTQVLMNLAVNTRDAMPTGQAGYRDRNRGAGKKGRRQAGAPVPQDVA